ncbi:DUF1772 domain-containing protein [Marinobacterium sp. YM272]|uniref:anthrone oxygenase family protein n=1 Tax=Marinobacterium sp. YM272 TaxID=3421654 RepID=UPI003D7FCC0F
MDILQISLIMSAFLCSLVAGFLFAYAVVIMPGIKALNDRDFIRAFQVTDRVIQNNQPVFVLVWIGSVIALIIAAILGIWRLQGVDLLLLSAATIFYLLGVQLSTIIINLPLNNKLQTYKVDSMNEAELTSARSSFEPRWNASNVVRTLISACVSLLLIMLVFRL